MCRLLGYLSMSPVSLQAAVGSGLDDFVNLSVKHGDGWGLAHIARESGQSRIYRRPEPARESATLRDLSFSATSDGAAFHLRWATPGLTVKTENTHPFIRGKYAFMHNGAISAAIDRLLSQQDKPLLEGDTDSEKYFLVLLACIARLGPLPGTKEAVEKISNLCDYTSLNAMLLTPDELLVVSLYRPERIPPNEPDDYYEIRFKAANNGIVVASTGWQQHGWTPLPNHSVTRIDRHTLEIATYGLA